MSCVRCINWRALRDLNLSAGKLFTQADQLGLQIRAQWMQMENALVGGYRRRRDDQFVNYAVLTRQQIDEHLQQVLTSYSGRECWIGHDGDLFMTRQQHSQPALGI